MAGTEKKGVGMGRFREICLPLEAVTPVWMGGAGAQPELRPPSLRGCLRFWLRALLGGALGEDLKALLAAEGAVFGNTQRASPVVVRMTGDPHVGGATFSEEEHRGVNYMFWSMYQRKREAILPGERFQLRMHGRAFDFQPFEVRGHTIDVDQSFELAAGALWLLLRMGGVGARARRGAGSLQPLQPPSGWPDTVPSPVTAAENAGDLAAELADGVGRLRADLPWPPAVPDHPSAYDCLHPEVCQIFVVDETFANWWEAIDWVGEQFVAFRRSYVDDASAIAQLLTQGRMVANTIHRAILGLPIVFFFKSIFESLTERGVPYRDARRKASATVVPKRGLGRGSPLVIRLAPLAGPTPRYAVIMIMFRSRFLPDREMVVKPQDRSIRPAWIDAPTTHQLIDDWFEYLKEQGAQLQPVAF